MPSSKEEACEKRECEVSRGATSFITDSKTVMCRSQCAGKSAERLAESHIEQAHHSQAFQYLD